ncbi:Ras family domain-containing protein, putative [Eimeria acervulina]|uniref:Ras family domain-containing protein, putative n=1 Tax=Eimeria acervulina TaxID=5801 RepID=U6G9F9_EIMAC|nr:Ras family domain-containing protein, putative [Eimeria acervulina]CDI76896.1 Ras family domain-containing protein, putative [Eimeria acervulina]
MVPPADVRRSPAATRKPSVEAAPRSAPLNGRPHVDTTSCTALTAGGPPSLDRPAASQLTLWAQAGLSAVSGLVPSSLPLLPPQGPLKPPISSIGAPGGASGNISYCETKNAQQTTTRTRPNFSALPWAPPFRSSKRRLWSSPGSLRSQHGTSRPLLGPSGPPSRGTHDPMRMMGPPQACRLKGLGLQGSKLQHRASAGDLLLLQQQQQRQQKGLAGVRREASWGHFFRGPRKIEERRGNTQSPDIRVPVASWSLLTVFNFSGAAKAPAEAAATAANDAAAADAKKSLYSSDAKTPGECAAAAAATLVAARETDGAAAAVSAVSALPRETPQQQHEEEMWGSLDGHAMLNVPRPEEAACAALEAAATAADSLSAFVPRLNIAAVSAPPAAAAVAKGKAKPGTVSETTGKAARLTRAAKPHGQAAPAEETSTATAAAPAPVAAAAATARTHTMPTAALSPSQADSAAPEADKGEQAEATEATEAVATAAAAALAATTASATPATVDGGCTRIPHPADSPPDSSRVVPPLMWKGIPVSDWAPEKLCNSSRLNSSRLSSSRLSNSSTSWWGPLASLSRRRWAVFDMPRPLRLKIVTIGPPCSGKSCLVRRFCERRFAGSHPGAPECGGGPPKRGPQAARTIGLDFGLRDVQLPTEETVRLHFFDISGDPQYSEAVEGAAEGCDVLLVVFDAAEPNSLRAAAETLERIRATANSALEALRASILSRLCSLRTQRPSLTLLCLDCCCVCLRISYAAAQAAATQHSTSDSNRLTDAAAMLAPKE